MAHSHLCPKIDVAIPTRNVLRKTDGVFAREIVVKGDAQMKVPDNMSDIDAATQGIAISTMVSIFWVVLTFFAVTNTK
jgi:D-arabinose 1-dehydrogenase-like Zn-dependent alcohol dehydrogenase